MTTGTGSRIRDRRLVLGIKQGALAKAAEISPSYLNLIEHDRRKVNETLLSRIAKALDIAPQVLTQGQDTALADEVRAAIGDAQGARGAETAGLDGFVTHYPGWARLLVAQAKRAEGLEQVVAGLDAQLSHDPVLSENMHDLLAAVSAIRSTSSILMANPEIAPDWRERFHSNIDSESRRLAETSNAIATLLDGLGRTDRTSPTPLDAALRFADAARYHFATLEQQGAAAVPELAAAQQSDARDLIEALLQRYAAEAGLMPLTRFGREAQRLDFDPAALAQGFGVDMVAAFRRLASLPRAAQRPDIGLLACDNAGALVFCKSPDRLAARGGGAICPRLPLFDALRQPDRAFRRIVTLDDGTRFEAFVLAERSAIASFEDDPIYTAWMLLIERPSEGNAQDAAREIGASCRMCRHGDCPARREPSILTLPTG